MTKEDWLKKETKTLRHIEWNHIQTCVILAEKLIQSVDKINDIPQILHNYCLLISAISREMRLVYPENINPEIEISKQFNEQFNWLNYLHDVDYYTTKYLNLFETEEKEKMNVDISYH